MRRPGASSKKFTSRVCPGVLLVRASERRAVMALMALDLPALERPAKATSVPRSTGNCVGDAALKRNWACAKRFIRPVAGRARDGVATSLRRPLAGRTRSVQFAALAEPCEVGR